MFVKVNCERLSLLRLNKYTLRSSNYTRLWELLSDASMPKNQVKRVDEETICIKITDIEKLAILPYTHIGDQRNMGQKIYNIVAISNSFGLPDVFIKMKCNPNWPEIQKALLPGQKADDGLDLCDRFFRMKTKLVLKHLQGNRLFGRVLAFMSVIELKKVISCIHI